MYPAPTFPRFHVGGHVVDGEDNDELEGRPVLTLVQRNIKYVGEWGIDAERRSQYPLSRTTNQFMKNLATLQMVGLDRPC